jgi:hypothetical protein
MIQVEFGPRPFSANSATGGLLPPRPRGGVLPFHWPPLGSSKRIPASNADSRPMRFEERPRSTGVDLPPGSVRLALQASAVHESPMLGPAHLNPISAGDGLVPKGVSKPLSGVQA